MNVKVTFKTLNSNKEMMFDAINVDIMENDILIKNVKLDSFTKDEFNQLANTMGVTITFIGKVINESCQVTDYARIYICKPFCSVEFMPSEEDRVRYLTSEIDKLSSELNEIING